MPPRIIQVHTASRAYQAVVGAGLLGELPERLRHAVPKTRRVMLVADAALTSVAETAALAIRQAGLEAIFDSHRTVVHPTEPSKSLHTVERLLVELATARLDRSDALIALGGGIVGDTAGFAASIYRRGIPWVNCPSTLLSMVDASVGGKTGVNLTTSVPAPHLHKNMVGAFWQPSLVLADTDLLKTLPERQVRCGLAECIKHGMLSGAFGDAGLFEWTRTRLEQVLRLDGASLAELIARNIAVKAAVVANDEREESGAADSGRALLNLGHTFGHAIETIGHLYLQHGEAVGLGLVAAAAAAEHTGLASHGLKGAVLGMLIAAGLPTALEHLPANEQLISLMQNDKKVAGGRLRLVLPRGDGTCVVVADPPLEAVRTGWDAIRAGA